MYYVRVVRIQFSVKQLYNFSYIMLYWDHTNQIKYNFHFKIIHVYYLSILIK